jgi:hypothetical protein
MMEKPLSLSRLGKRILLLAGLSLLPLLLEAQSKPLATVLLRSPAESAYVDRPGDLYVRFKSGKIVKYDVNGKQLSEYTPGEDVTLFDPRDGARAFMYSAKGHWYTYSFFGSPAKIKLREEYAIEPVMACSSGDKDLWVFDQSDYSLKKINTTRQTVDVEAPLPDHLKTGNTSIVTMREYQSLLFLLIRDSGLHIFSSMGRWIKSIEGSSITYFNFLGQELYYHDDNRLVFYDLFDGDIREAEIEPNVRFVLMTDARVYKIFSDRLEIYPVNY